MKLQNFLIIYDIFDTKRLYRVRKLVTKYSLGGQKSALETPLSKNSIINILETLENIIEDNDRVNIIKIVGEPILLGKAYKLKYNGVINENSNN